jgi:peptidoglycan/LPS O-acetylase OafA/YrhL
MAIFLCFGLIVLFREKLNFTTSILKFLAANSYAAYIFHFPIVLSIQYSLDRVYIFGALGKFMAVSLLSIITTYFIASLIRSLPYAKKVL